MIPNLDFIRTMLEGIRESVFARIKSTSAGLEHRISVLDARIQPPDYAAAPGKPGHILNKPALVGRSGDGECAEVFNHYESNTAAGAYAHAEGNETVASGDYGSHAEGNGTTASGRWGSHAEGMNTVASGGRSHAEGSETVASGLTSHAEGHGTKATESWAHAEGYNTEASGSISHAEGNMCVAKGYASHAEGYNTIAASDYQHVQGKYNVEDAEHQYLHIVGNGKTTQNDAGETVELRSNAHTLDSLGNAWFARAVYVGSTSGIDWDGGSKKLATEEYVNGVAMGSVSVVAGVGSEGTGDSAEVFNGGAAENASGGYAHAEGSNTIASGYAAHAEGQGSQATNFWSHAEGYECRSTGLASHAEGMGTIAASSSQHAEGSYNIEDADDKYLRIVGNGSSDTDRTNAHTLDWDGNAWFAGTVEGTALILKSPSGKRFRITVNDNGALSAAALTT